MKHDYTELLEKLASQGAMFDDSYDKDIRLAYEAPRFPELLVSPIELSRAF
ncbi:MAG: hypothetical protein IAC61_06245 [Firmicutes bacterium]|uniref:Uncharacterized protein n=1 Tax=Candidatus Alloenteromonas pullistercoris TaxID=2840785 RepID=A0A9D9GTP8_9FIRM|nr:hypothetical protein [Candidatus Enteromonas pullistercoris]